MNYEDNDLFYPEDQEMVNDIDSNVESSDSNEDVQDVQDVRPDTPHMSFNPAIIAYGVNRVQDIPAVKDFVNDCKETLSDKISETKETISDFISNIGDNVKDFTAGVYDDIKSFFTGSSTSDTATAAYYSREFSETREFGIDHCVEAAQEFFNPGVVYEWATLSDQQRADICCGYANEVAKAFELENYNGVIFEQLEPGVFGYNNGDGYIHISTDLLNPLQTPLNLVDTITHELRHQYQSECIEGYHDVADEVRNEWTLAHEIYTDQQACCFDPWGYKYNPLEIDSRFAGETVVREISQKMFNDAIAQA